MSPLGRPKGEYRRAQPEGTPVSPETPERADADVLQRSHENEARALHR